jgi:AAA+ ATPase superfamily predicted ATPase
MDFYGRKTELELMERTRQRAETRSQMTVLIGRRRIGKTSLILKSVEKTTHVYLFVSRKNELLLCRDFVAEIQKALGVTVFGEITTFQALFTWLLELAKTRHFTVILDEFQEFTTVNASVFSDMQNLWDRNRQSTRMHLILSGSVYSMMTRIFENAKEPLFGRADERIHLSAFDIETLRTIAHEQGGKVSNRDLLAFYTVTGGVAKYVEALADRKAIRFEKLTAEIFREHAFWLEEGKNLLVEELGKDYVTYFSILSLISGFKTGRGEIESTLGINIGGFLDRLINHYRIVKPVRPLLAKPGGKIMKYYIDDNFLAFWFRFMFKYRTAIEMGNFEALKQTWERDFQTYAGRFLEKWFVEQLQRSGEYQQLGSWWEKGGNEIDIVAVDDLRKKLLFAEVKLQTGRFNPSTLIQKSAKLLARFPDYEPEYKVLSLTEM